jgi:hypothetical protein
MNRIILFSLLFVLGISSCKKSDNRPSYPDDSLVSAWIHPQYTDSIITFERSEKLIPGDYGLLLKNNYSLTERKNSGWCGTPPIVYGDFEGNWSKSNDTLNMEVGFWGGTTHIKWQVLSVDDNELRVKQLAVEYFPEENTD